MSKNSYFVVTFGPSQKKFKKNVLTIFRPRLNLASLKEKTSNPTGRNPEPKNERKIMKTQTVELEIGPNCCVPVAVADLVNNGTPTQYFWELWNKCYTANKRWMREYGLAPRKVDGRWIVG